MYKQVRIFLTAPEFIKWINETFPKAADDQRTDEEYALWAVCLQEAHAVFDSFGTKDVADLFLNGIPAKQTNPIQSIQEWLDTIYAELTAAMDAGDVDMSNVVGDFITRELADAYAVADVVAAVTIDFGKR